MTAPERKESSEKAGGDAEASPELVLQVQQLLEELLSRDKIAEDMYVQSHMNASMYIPAASLAMHHTIVKLGPKANVDLILAAAKKSDRLLVDSEGQAVRPIIKQKRNTLILHDLPADISEQELRDLFAPSSEASNLSSVKPDVNNTAFIAFSTDESAQTAALWLRSQKLRGESVKCAMKSEHAVRSCFPATPLQTPSLGPQGAGTPVWTPGGQNPSWPSSPWTGPAGASWGAAMYDSEMWGGGGGWTGEEGGGRGEETKGKGDMKGGKGKFRGKKGGMDMLELEMRLQMEAQAAEMAASGIEIDEVEPGYSHEFRKYGRQDIIEICSAMAEVKKPDTFVKLERDDKDFPLFRQNPCKDWLPLPAPMVPFNTGVLGNNEGGGHHRSGGGGHESEAEEGGHGASRNRRRSRPRKESAASEAWPPRAGSRSTQGEKADGREESYDWDQGWSQSGWTADDGGRWRSSSRRRYQGWATEWSDSNWGGKRGREGGGDDKGVKGSRSQWVEKSKAAPHEKGAGAVSHKWQAKAKRDASEGARSGSKSASPGKAAAAAGKGSSGPTGGSEPSSTTQEHGKASSQSWADKVRMGKGQS